MVAQGQMQNLRGQPPRQRGLVGITLVAVGGVAIQPQVMVGLVVVAIQALAVRGLMQQTIPAAVVAAQGAVIPEVMVDQGLSLSDTRTPSLPQHQRPDRPQLQPLAATATTLGLAQGALHSNGTFR